MPLALDKLTRIINVQWGEESFLYSGGDGMFASSDGISWRALKEDGGSVPATSLAFVDGVWVASSESATWRSEDGAKTWAAGGPPFLGVAAMKPKGVDAEGNPKPGLFIGWAEDDEVEVGEIHLSTDLGQSWSVVLTLPRTVEEDGYETIYSVDGCGGAFFVSTIRGETRYHHGSGMIYSSTDGSFSDGQIVFGPGNETPPEDFGHFPRRGFSATGVGFDEKTGTYIAIGNKQIISGFGVQESYMIYTTSGNPSFGGGDGNVLQSAVNITPGGGEFISVYTGAAGGAGKHLGGLTRTTFDAFGPVSSVMQAHFIPGSPQSLSNSGGFLGSFCFKKTDENTGVFACVAFSGGSGGVFTTASSESFSRTHSGSPIAAARNDQLGTVAVGNVSF